MIRRSHPADREGKLNKKRPPANKHGMIAAREEVGVKSKGCKRLTKGRKVKQVLRKHCMKGQARHQMKGGASS